MARLTGRAKAEFLARMAAGRGRRRNPRRGRHKKWHRIPGHMRRTANPLLEGLLPAATALVVNPENPMRKPRRHRRKRNALMLNPKRRRRSRRRNALMLNPRRRRHRRNLVVFNPAGIVGGIVGDLVTTGLPALAGGAIANFIDGKFLGSKSGIIRAGGKLGLGLVGAMVLRKVAPKFAGGFMGGVFGAIGGDLGARAAGGLPSIPAVKATAKGLSEMAAEDEQIGALLEGLGFVVEAPTTSGDDGIGSDEMAPGMAGGESEDTSYQDMEIESD